MPADAQAVADAVALTESTITRLAKASRELRGLVLLPEEVIVLTQALTTFAQAHARRGDA